LGKKADQAPENIKKKKFGEIKKPRDFLEIARGRLSSSEEGGRRTRRLAVQSEGKRERRG